MVVRANSDGSFVRLRDIGRSELGAEVSDWFARYNGNGGETALIGIYKSPGENAVAATHAVADEMERLSKAFPDNVEYDISYNTTRFVEASIEEVIHTLRDALILVILVVYLFLGNFRATLIPIIAVPVSIVGAGCCVCRRLPYQQPGATRISSRRGPMRLHDRDPTTRGFFGQPYGRGHQAR